MQILVSTSKIKEQNMSSKVTVETGKPTKTKPAMAKIVVSTSAKKNAATITFKPTKEATLEKPKYEARLNRMGKGFRMKNAAECIAALKPFGFDSKDAKPIRDFYAGRITAAQFKKAMGTKTYTAKEDAKALEVIKLVNAAKLPTSGKGKVTRKMVDAIFADYQRFPVIREVDVKKLLKAIEAHNAGTLKPAALKSIRSLFARSQTNKRNPKISAMAKHFNAAIATMEAEAGTSPAKSTKKDVASGTTPSQKRFPNIKDSKVARFALDLLEKGKISERQATTLNNLFGKVEDKSATLETFKKINAMFRKPEGSHPRLLGQVTYAVDQMQKKAGIKDKVTPPVLDVRLVSQRHGGTKMVIGQFRGTQPLGGVVVTPATDGGKPSYSRAASFGETFGSTKRSALSMLRKIDGFTKTHEELIDQYANGGLSRTAFMKAFKSGKKATSTAKPKSTKAPAGKAQGTQISNDDFNLELPIDSKLTAAEANKVMAYFSQLLANKEVAKTQASRALKELVEGSMTDQMKKRWLARVGGSEIRPVPRKLVTILRDTVGK